MKNILYIFIICILYSSNSWGQITAAEYFVDSDPGVGSATPLTVIPGDTIDESFAIPSTGIPEGLHVLHIRVKDDDGNWSLFYRQHFYVLKDASSAPTSKPIVAAEYFIGANPGVAGTDPGIGSGTALTVTSGDIINEVFNIPISGSTADGDYTLHIRVKDDDGNWSLYYKGAFTVREALSLDDVLLAKSITLYPNPVSDILTIDSKIPLTKVEIYSILGQKVREISSGFNSILLSNLSNGIYIVRLQSENGFVTKKLIKK
ncbi:MAG: T9SS type A sorting domain-containing protein [Flavobacteriaceae bacterium]|nr:T9SS type A sorting domain-containing protein [Flavobacteriaceae bacterium]